MRQHSKTGVRIAFSATVLVAILLTGLASYRAWSPDRAKRERPVVQAKEKRESDMPPPGFLRKRWGTGSATYQPKQQPLAPSAPSAVSNWIPIGPTQMTDVDSNTILEPSQGRVNCVAVSPSDQNRILVGAASGGVWLSTDGGTNWSPRTDHLPVLGVADIEFAPSDSNIVYMATGDGIAFATPSVGVYKSTDGGATWNPTGLVFDPISFTILKKLAVHPTDPNVVYVAELNRLYKTTNGGTNWDPINPGGLNNDFPMYDVKLKPGNPSTVYAMSNNGAFRRSTNSGASWDPVPPGLPASSAVRRCQIAVTPVNSDIVYVICAEQSTNGLNGVYLSTNGGSSFGATAGTAGALSDFGNQADYDMSIAVSPTSSSEVFIGGVLPLRSQNAGGSWSPITGFEGGFFPGLSITHVDIHDLQFAHGALYACTDGGLHRSTDMGAHWTDLSQKLQIAQIYHFSVTDQNGGLVYAGEQDNGLNRLQNGKWEHVKVGDWGQPLIHPQSTDLVFAGSNGGNVKSLDGFKFFEVNLNIASEPSRFPGAVFAVDPNDLQIAYAGLRNVHKSTTFGDSGTWTPGTNFTDNMVVHAMAVAPSNTQVIYASRADFSNAMMLRSTTGGTSFGNISGNGLPNKLVTGMAIDPANPDRVWVALQDSQGNVVYRTENGGASWTNYSGSLTTLSAHTIVYEKGSQDAVYVGTNAGVFRRDATMADWEPFNTNLPNAIISDLQINYSTGRLRAATYGRGVWETLLPGTTLNALLNVSTRLQVGTGDNILIGGFIITGPGDKTVLFRAIGPSLSSILPGAISDTTLELRNAAGTLLGSNDNWKVTQIGGNITGNQFFAIKSSGVAPTHDNEAAIVATLAPGSYTAVLRGANNSTGIGVVEGYDLTQAIGKFGNISTRGFVQTGDGAMIGGFILGNQTTRVVVRAIGPFLGQFGVPDPLADPTLEVRNSNGGLLVSNNNWKTRDSDGSSQEAQIQATGLAPSNDFESAVELTLPPGSYTGIVRGVNSGTGNGLVEAYNLQ
jgi:photosystem II stability/assembly factor-like uncharacterized protein